MDTLIIVGGVAVFVIAIAAVAILSRPYRARKKALAAGKGSQSATPIRRQSKTNPDYTREDAFRDLGSEENEFLKRQ